MARSLSLVCAMAVACLCLLAGCEASYPVYKGVAPHYAVHDPYTHYKKHCATRDVKIIDDIFEPRHHGPWARPHVYHGYGYPGYGYHGYGGHHYGYPGYGYPGYGSHYYGYPALKAAAW